METMLNIFENEEFGQIRVIMIEDEPWFVGKDVADNLGYQNGSRDINRHVEEDDRIKEMIFDGNQNKETILINESGLYALIFGSQLKSAKKFKHWVTSEVLPTIRKTGSYTYKEKKPYQAPNTRIAGSNTPIPELGDWYSFAKPKIETICEIYSINKKNLYHLILTRVQGNYNWDYAVSAYMQETGHAPRYAMDVVAHFQQLQEEANYVIDTLLVNAGYEV